MDAHILINQTMNRLLVHSLTFPAPCTGLSDFNQKKKQAGWFTFIYIFRNRQAMYAIGAIGPENLYRDFPEDEHLLFDLQLSPVEMPDEYLNTRYCDVVKTKEAELEQELKTLCGAVTPGASSVDRKK